LAELIYTTAEAMFNQSKGYLSIFRNLTDAEPLAREVMQHLAQQDAQQQPARAEAAAAQPAPAAPDADPTSQIPQPPATT